LGEIFNRHRGEKTYCKVSQVEYPEPDRIRANHFGILTSAGDYVLGKKLSWKIVNNVIAAMDVAHPSTRVVALSWRGMLSFMSLATIVAHWLVFCPEI